MNEMKLQTLIVLKYARPIDAPELRSRFWMAMIPVHQRVMNHSDHKRTDASNQTAETMRECWKARNMLEQ